MNIFAHIVYVCVKFTQKRTDLKHVGCGETFCVFLLVSITFLVEILCAVERGIYFGLCNIRTLAVK